MRVCGSVVCAYNIKWCRMFFLVSKISLITQKKKKTNFCLIPKIIAQAIFRRIIIVSEMFVV